MRKYWRATIEWEDGDTYDAIFAEGYDEDQENDDLIFFYGIKSKKDLETNFREYNWDGWRVVGEVEEAQLKETSHVDSN